MNDSEWWPLKWDKTQLYASYKNVHIFNNSSYKYIPNYHIVVQNKSGPNKGIMVDDELSLRCILLELLGEQPTEL